jgi:MATE family multidrug resistance protein
VLAGVMRGCGRQRIGAIINLVTYWLFGLPVACLLAFPGKHNASWGIVALSRVPMVCLVMGVLYV